MNCLIVDDEPIAREIMRTHLQKLGNVKIVAECSSAMEAFAHLHQTHIDLVFLDINMPEITGLSFMKLLSKDVKVIFTTAYREYAVDGFDLEAVDYLLKPISFERLLQAVRRYYKVEAKRDEGVPTKKEGERDHFFVRADRKMVRINYADILFIESYSDYVKIQTIAETVVSRENISAMENILPAGDFIRIHRSFIVAKNKIEAYTHEIIEIKGRELPISRSYKEQVLFQLNQAGG
ncbi:LytR/AlgR family response regulator transcription factor [Fulvivirga sediminis]|uniref:Response regulator transcription factor n=1 Tax=Fulvivirga sediminis TaxID=2803949 RepID=A0A937FC33_9BACT|nr:LytTR family DNA-binding domain-containing protein [Fulvivirga sediminis]MBL3658054.1 response regulator transcription factor [Fulvivirga sediminis]